VKYVILPLLLVTSAFAAEQTIHIKRLDPKGKEIAEIIRRAADARGIRPFSITILQHVEGSLYLATKGRETVAVDLDKEMNPADGEQFTLFLKQHPAHFEYLSVLGSKATVKRFTASQYPSEDLSPIGLVASLKKGGSISYIHGTAKGKCSVCKGFGYTRTSERGAKPGKSEVDCPTCNNGLVPVPQKWVVKW
jgi:hypothetical protein